MSKPIPILFLSDAPTAGTGLGRITRDLATRLHKHLPDMYRVATAGYGGLFSRELGFPQYELGMQDWVVFNLPAIWKDFAGSEQGILFVIWDCSRVLWLSRPENCGDPLLQRFLQSHPFKLWTYTPMDASGPNGKLTMILKHTLEGFDRVLAYSKWAEDILRNTIESRPILDKLTNLPHGIDTKVFYPRNRTVARHGFGDKLRLVDSKGRSPGIPDDALAIGIVATNQARKDWGLGIQTVAEIAKTRRVFLWCHTDRPENTWSIPGLITDFGLNKCAVMTTQQFSDEQMALAYSAMDVTLGIGNGEGFGFPIFESMACGTPCIHGDYGGAAEHLPPPMLVNADASRLDTAYSCVRRVYSPYEWRERVMDNEKTRTTLTAHLDWNELWARWEAWFKEAAND